MRRRQIDFALVDCHDPLGNDVAGIHFHILNHSRRDAHNLRQPRHSASTQHPGPDRLSVGLISLLSGARPEWH